MLRTKKAQQAFGELREVLAEEAVLVSPDYVAAADPEGSGRGVELWWMRVSMRGVAC